MKPPDFSVLQTFKPVSDGELTYKLVDILIHYTDLWQKRLNEYFSLYKGLPVCTWFNHVHASYPQCAQNTSVGLG